MRKVCDDREGRVGRTLDVDGIGLTHDDEGYSPGTGGSGRGGYWLRRSRTEIGEPTSTPRDRNSLRLIWTHGAEPSLNATVTCTSKPSSMTDCTVPSMAPSDGGTSSRSWG